MTTIKDPGEANCVQADVLRAAQQIVLHELPLTAAGAVECEQIMREFGEGYRPLWVHPHYLRSTIYTAHEIIREARKPPRRKRDR